MPSVYRDVTVEVDIDLDDFDDEDLIKEIKARGYRVSEEPDISSIEEYWNQGNRKESLILLERKFPELYGISNLAN
jgi:hypothetical protein